VRDLSLAERDRLRIHTIADDAALSLLHGNIEYWDIALTLYMAGAAGIEGSNALIRNIHKKKLSDVTLFNFMKTCVEKGFFIKSRGAKKNTFNIRLSAELHRKITLLLERVYDCPREASDGYAGQG